MLLNLNIYIHLYIWSKQRIITLKVVIYIFYFLFKSYLIFYLNICFKNHETVIYLVSGPTTVLSQLFPVSDAYTCRPEGMSVRVADERLGRDWEYRTTGPRFILTQSPLWLRKHSRVHVLFNTTTYRRPGSLYHDTSTSKKHVHSATRAIVICSSHASFLIP